MPKMQTIALDALGGDFGPSVVVPAALSIAKAHPDLHLILVGVTDKIAQHLPAEQLHAHANISVHHASEEVGMDEPPALALKRKKDSSMRVAIDLVKEAKADACVSAGNTGALMATAKFVLKTLPGISRPAICGILPTAGGHTHMLDLGANVECSPEQLYQFGVMGSMLASAVDHTSKPRVGLLNIGSEAMKGNETVKAANELFADGDLNYQGFIEGNDIFGDVVDVVVTDGFTGNVSLKTTEGLAKMITQFMREEFSRNVFTRLLALMVLPVLKAFKNRIDPRLYNGASFLGLNGIVVKSHGGADQLAYENAIRIAKLQVEQAVPNKISKHLDGLLNEKEVA